MNKNILTFVLVFSLLSFVGIASAKDGADDVTPRSSVSSDVKSSSSDDSDEGLEIEAEIFSDGTIVKVEVNDVKSTFTTTAKTEAEIAAEVLVKYPSLTSAEVDSALKIETEDRASRPSDSVSNKSDDNDDDSDDNSGAGEDHRSAVANAVLKLKELAGKDKKIGEEVSKIAQEQNDSAEKAAKAIEAIEKRSGWKVFLVGTDYKNLGGLRSEMVTTSNHIDRLTKALEKTTSPTVKAALDLEIKALEVEKLKVETFISTNESKFSLFGWLARALAK
jgi:hypothetical protein